MKFVAIIVLSYNMPEMVTALVDYLSTTLDYPNKDIYVVDSNSSTLAACVTHRLRENLGVTKGMMEGYRIASAVREYDAYWFLNQDIGFDDSNQVLRNLVDVLFSDDRFAQISPQHNSPHAHMNAADFEAQEVPFLEATAPLVKTSTIQNIGFWDSSFTLGWGVDLDYGWRIRQAGLKNIITNRARITHKHESSYDRNEYATRANAEMVKILTQKYGPDFMRITRMETPSLSVCAIFRNESPYLREWIEFHRRMGVGKFYLYQNRSEDDWQSILAPYMIAGIVDVTDWPQMMHMTDGRSAQIDVYQDCINRLHGQSGWLAFIDCDEFLFAPRHDTVTEAMSLLPQTWGAIGVHWMVFGSSGKTEWEDIPVIERFTWRPNENNLYNLWYKSIVRLDDPDLRTLGSPHRFCTRNGTFNEEGKRLTEDNHPHVSSLLRVNHYFTKSRKEWEERHPVDTSGSCFPRADERWTSVQAKDVDDRTVQRFLPTLKARLK
jgi:GT2 family glycosyltransferase